MTMPAALPVTSGTATATLAAQKAGLASKAAKARALDEKAEEFTGVFMAQMLQPMFETIKVNDSFGGGAGEDTMRVFLVQEFGRAMAKGDRSGLTDAIKSELLRLQETGGSAIRKEVESVS